jgi:hypothetical protein
VLRPFGTGRNRTVRRRRARHRDRDTAAGPLCSDSSATQILLPTELVLRRATAPQRSATLVANARGVRTIAAKLGRPESTVRRWLRAVREPHAQWLYLRGVDRAALIDRELLVRPAPQRTTFGHALNLLAGAAVILPSSAGTPGWGIRRTRWW